MGGAAAIALCAAMDTSFTLILKQIEYLNKTNFNMYTQTCKRPQGSTGNNVLKQQILLCVMRRAWPWPSTSNFHSVAFMGGRVGIRQKRETTNL